MASFVPGLLLAQRFYHEAVRPILDQHFPTLRHSAALIGYGSEVLGFDTPMSTDHHWGPRAMLFLQKADRARHADAIREVLSHHLPTTFLGWPTNFSEPDPTDNDVQHLQAISHGPVNHRVEIFSTEGFVHDYLGVTLDEPLTAVTWLTLPSQKLRSITAGAVFHDDLGLDAVRRRFAWYLHDVWLYLLAAGWTRIGQEEHLMGRAGHLSVNEGS